MPIPDGISKQDVLNAIAEFDEGAKHSFGESTKYDLLYEGRRYPPKAIVGLAARRVVGRPLRPDEFSGGEDAGHANDLLKKHGFQIIQKEDGVPTWHLKPGDRIRRVDLHAEFGGQGHGGISTPRTGHVFLFTDPKSGHQHGYFDRWEGDVFHYTGEGQRGDQVMERGNKAILQHEQNGKALRVFEGVRDTVRYLDEFSLADPPYYEGHAPETAGGPIRKVIIFRMRPKREGAPVQQKKESQQYSWANESPQTPPVDPFVRDPNQLDRALAAHAKTQNALYSFLKKAGVLAWSPAPGDPDFDLAWSRRGDCSCAR